MYCIASRSWPGCQGEPEATVDAVVAADVFVYVGDLAAMFGQAYRVLRPGGLFGFSVEAVDGDSFVLRTSLRFGHSDQYIRS